jgi:putative Holliday junction resolvase
VTDTTPQVIMGLDYGLRRLGAATGDTLTRTARPLATVAVTDQGPDWTHLDRLVGEWGPARFIVGIPYNAAGGDSPLAVKVRAFAAELTRRYTRPVDLLDEHLTSNEAQDRLRERRASGARQRRVRHGDIDPVAAAVLLEQWLARTG